MEVTGGIMGPAKTSLSDTLTSFSGGQAMMQEQGNVHAASSQPRDDGNSPFILSTYQHPALPVAF